ncbi:hypothetical protein VNI00_006622 [Paramarasmius palmivorus]|uniref:Uncharacterized protein n=1 Tax=Paramarasmius palmivorus TaxID=297713 RepID=A0AAW0D4G4_9AGAR
MAFSGNLPFSTTSSAKPFDPLAADESCSRREFWEEMARLFPNGNVASNPKALPEVYKKLSELYPGEPWLWKGYHDRQQRDDIKVINMDPTEEDFTHEYIFKRPLSPKEPSSSNTNPDPVSVLFLYHTLDRFAGEDIVYVQLQVKSRVPVQLQQRRDGLVEDVILDESGRVLVPVASSVRISRRKAHRPGPSAVTEWFIFPDEEDANHLAVKHV